MESSERLRYASLGRIVVLGLIRRLSRRAVRAVAVLLLALFAAGIPTEVATAFAAFCADDCGDCGSGGADHEGEGDCTCPLGCAACCAPSAPRATASAFQPLVEDPAHFVFAPRWSALSYPPDGALLEILHVPKR